MSFRSSVLGGSAALLVGERLLAMDIPSSNLVANRSQEESESSILFNIIYCNAFRVAFLLPAFSFAEAVFVVTDLTPLQVASAGAVVSPAEASRHNLASVIEGHQRQFACGGYTKRHIGAWITFIALLHLISREERYNYRELIRGTAFVYIYYAMRNADPDFISRLELIRFY